MYRVLRNLFAPASLEDLRESIERTMDRGATAFKIAELMDRHGNEDWLEPLVDQLGPAIQLQVNDLANMLEVLDKYAFLLSAAACLTITASITGDLQP